jgi:putative membrane protein
MEQGAGGGILVPSVTFTFQVFFLGCVIVAGVFGACTASRKIFVVQALPAIIALAFVLAGHP